MEIIEFDQLLSTGQAPVLGSIEGIIVKSDPDRKQFGSDLEWLCAGLKNTIITSDEGFDLIPLTEADLENGFPHRLVDAWSNEELRRGYFPSTPKSYKPIIEVITDWIKEPTGVTYRVAQSSHVDTLCYIRVEFSVNQLGELEAVVFYGNINPNFLRKGLTTASVGTLINGIRNEAPRYGFNLKRVVATVSDRNTGSVKVLGRNGFLRDPSQPVTKSPIAMGGNTISVSLDF